MTTKNFAQSGSFSNTIMAIRVALVVVGAGYVYALMGNTAVKSVTGVLRLMRTRLSRGSCHVHGGAVY